MKVMKIPGNQRVYNTGSRRGRQSRFGNVLNANYHLDRETWEECI